ncbi:TMhelix containing protein [Vibrio phage 1.081.O._10N.286.52.C2]|nr:TMhelix containing protein [Vibrio phage 1.081.O._10N.286.52.C2]
MKFKSYDSFGVVEYNIGMIFAGLMALSFTIALTAASLLYRFESGADGSNINSAGDALWTIWMSMSTIGFGDHYPVTVGGRVIVGSMFAVGATLIGLNIGIASAWVTSKFDKSVQNRVLKLQSDTLIQKIDRLETFLNVDQTVYFGPDAHGIDETLKQKQFDVSQGKAIVTLGRDDGGRFIVATNTQTDSGRNKLKWISYLKFDDALDFYNDVAVELDAV